jgi:hypothetical protein
MISVDEIHHSFEYRDLNNVLNLKRFYQSRTRINFDFTFLCSFQWLYCKTVWKWPTNHRLDYVRTCYSRIYLILYLMKHSLMDVMENNQYVITIIILCFQFIYFLILQIEHVKCGQMICVTHWITNYFSFNFCFNNLSNHVIFWNF